MSETGIERAVAEAIRELSALLESDRTKVADGVTAANRAIDSRAERDALLAERERVLQALDAAQAEANRPWRGLRETLAALRGEE